MDHHITLIPTGKFGTKGERYEAWLSTDGDGKRIVYSGSEPVFNTCRALVERNFSGFVKFWRPEKKTWDMRVALAIGATRAVSEGEKHGPRIGKWAPHPNAEENKQAS